MAKRKALIMLGALAILVLPLLNVSHATLLNGDFSAGLTGWETSGDVTAMDGAAGLGDNKYTYSYLYQPIALSPLTYTIQFDFKNTLSPDLSKDSNSFFDSFYSSLYFVNNLSNFDLSTPPVGDDGYGLFDLQHDEPFNVNGVISASSKGQDWLHFSMNFYNAYNYVIPTFELIDFNFINNDSQVLIDNVQISPVPEPATFLLLASGLAGLGGFLRKRKQFMS